MSAPNKPAPNATQPQSKRYKVVMQRDDAGNVIGARFFMLDGRACYCGRTGDPLPGQPDSARMMLDVMMRLSVDGGALDREGPHLSDAVNKAARIDAQEGCGVEVGWKRGCEVIAQEFNRIAASLHLPIPYPYSGCMKDNLSG